MLLRSGDGVASLRGTGGGEAVGNRRKLLVSDQGGRSNVLAELDRTVDKLGFRGVELSTNVRGVDLTRAGLEKFFARVLRRFSISEGIDIV